METSTPTQASAAEPATAPPDTLTAAIIDDEDRHFKRRIGWFTLAALTFTGMIGSGWLFASYYAAGMAGPAALGSWIIAAIATALVGLTFIELGVTRPIAGGSTRWPSILSGPFVGIMIGWVLLLQTAFGTPSEASGLLQYASNWWPALVDHGKLSVLGLVLAAVVLVLFTGLNWFGVLVMTRISNVITIFKLIVPLITIVLLFASGFDATNVQTGGGFAPYGGGGMLTAVIGAGLIYSFGGIQTPAVMAGEARNPRRNIPLGTFVGFAAAFVVYILLQSSYIWTIPNDLLAKGGWHGLNFDSPFAQLAGLLNLAWLTQLLLVDAVVSPAGSLLLGIGTNGRVTYGVAQGRILPRWVIRVNEKTGIPHNALIVNLVISIVFLLVFQSWQGLVASLGFFFAVGYSVIAVAAGVNSRDPRLIARPWMKKGMGVVAPVSFVISGLILYWSGWQQIWISVLLFAISLPIAVIVKMRDKEIFTTKVLLQGAWFFVYMLFILGASALGSFGGANLVAGPWDSILVAVITAGFYVWGYRSSIAWLYSKAAADAVGVYY
ncbi:APC family permease [Microbacterium capsulatum]|uniref:APC family permease n=1 Tax=Microbacterium capsulatum TaxID=3041921 RepID=A0ABU0XFW6_9MICO|nr:APC family permease [Microbacterium sp. ASV81]MDQ4214019.1 APC family permease [Microbacterium sp. ASV81]